MNEKAARFLELMNGLHATLDDYDCDGRELQYILVPKTAENIELSRQLADLCGFSHEDYLENGDVDGAYLEITLLWQYGPENMVWDSERGFYILEGGMRDE